jgi:hypothetical protein
MMGAAQTDPSGQVRAIRRATAADLPSVRDVILPAGELRAGELPAAQP